MLILPCECTMQHLWHHAQALIYFWCASLILARICSPLSCLFNFTHLFCQSLYNYLHNISHRLHICVSSALPPTLFSLHC